MEGIEYVLFWLWSGDVLENNTSAVMPLNEEPEGSDNGKRTN
jgi:hypothetical protein